MGDLLGVDPEAMMRAYCKPKIRVGTEWVTKGQNIDQSTQSVAGIARGVYDRVFRFLVEKCNVTLVDPTMKKVVFIGVLDIAGFEIFKVRREKIGLEGREGFWPRRRIPSFVFLTANRAAKCRWTTRFKI